MRKLILKQIDRQERALGASLDWLRALLSASLLGFLRFLLLTPLGHHRQRLPKNAWYVARLAATLHEECGSCAQIVVNLARKDGISRVLVNSVMHGQPERLSDELADVYHFTQSVLRQSDDGVLRETLRSRYGEQGLVDLALTIATARIIPTTRRAMGYAQTRTLLRAAA
jgi:alkylhydroperoxidase family enzyme